MANKVAGELYESITGQLFELGRQLRQPNGYPFDPNKLKVALQAAIEGKFGDIRKQSLFSVAVITNLGAVDGKPTKEFFRGSRWAYRDSDFDRWFPAHQSRADD